MRIHVRYCNICQKKIPDLEWETKEALEWENFFYCADHAEQGAAIIERMIRDREEKKRKKEEEEAQARAKKEEEARAKAKEEQDLRRQHLAQKAPRRSPIGSRGKPATRGKGYRGKGTVIERRPISKRFKDPEEGEKDDRESGRLASKAGKGSRAFARPSRKKTGPVGRKPSSTDLEIQPLSEDDMKDVEGVRTQNGLAGTADGSTETAAGIKGYAHKKRSSSKRLRAIRTHTSRRAAASGRQAVSGRQMARERSKAIWAVLVVSILVIAGIAAAVVFVMRRDKPDQPQPDRVVRPEPRPSTGSGLPRPDVTVNRFDIAGFVGRVENWAGDEQTYESLDAEIRKAGEGADPADQEMRQSISQAFGVLKERRETLAEQAASALKMDIHGLVIAGNAAGIRDRLDSYPDIFVESAYGAGPFSLYRKEVESLLSDVEELESINLSDDLAGVEPAAFEKIKKTLSGFTKFPEGSAWNARVQDIRKRIDDEFARRERAAANELTRKRRAILDGVMGGAEALIQTGRPRLAIERLQAFIDKYPGTPEAGVAKAKIDELLAGLEEQYLKNFFTGDSLAGWSVENGATVNVADGVAMLKNSSPDGKGVGLFKGKPYWRDYELNFSFMRESGLLTLFLRADSSSDGAGDRTVEFDGPPFRKGVWYDVKVRLTGGVLEISTSLDGVPHRTVISAKSGGIGFRVGPGGEASIKGITVSLSR